MDLPAVDLCYDALFEKLRPDTIVMLFNVLICQHNVVVTSDAVDGLTDVMEVALSLLWCVRRTGLMNVNFDSHNGTVLSILSTQATAMGWCLPPFGSTCPRTPAWFY